LVQEVIKLSNVIYDKLDPLFETIALISVSRNIDETKSETVRALDEMGIDGKKFYASQMSVFEDYVQEFKENYKPGEDDALFFDGSGSSLLLLIICIILENREHVGAVDRFKDSEINAEIIELCCALHDLKPAKRTNKIEDIMAFIDACSFTEGEKWKLLQIMKSPKKHITQLVATISTNTTAFEKAQDKVRTPLKKLIAQYTKTVKDGEKQIFGKLKKSLTETADVYPSLAYPIAQLMFSNCCYYGLLSTLLVKQEGPDQDMILRCLKALSDSSRLEILRSLKQKPKYNLEIAEQLGLTAATMSHHMSMLLTCGFVGVNKQESKVYYHLEEEAVNQFIQTLRQTLI
jgi:DNA-binding transcriptional ArsR family regulator